MHECLPGIFVIPLEERQGGANTIELYLVRGQQRNLLIDAGFSTEWCFAQLSEALDALGVSIASLDVFLTHKHADHCGLARRMQLHGAEIFLNREEDRHQYDCLYYRTDHSNEQAQLRVLRRNGITAEYAPLIWEKYMDINHHLMDTNTVWMMTIEEFDYRDILPGQSFDYGDYHFQAIPLRGHTYGQMGLLDGEKKLLFAADQILNRTTPIVGTSHSDEHLLKHYLDSLTALAEKYTDYTILPAHEGPIEDLKVTVERVMRAYRRKIDQTYACVLPETEQTVWQIAKQVYGLTPDKRSDAAFYNAKMITTKTFSMLEYLYDTGKIFRREENGTLFWKR